MMNRTNMLRSAAALALAMGISFAPLFAVAQSPTPARKPTAAAAAAVKQPCVLNFGLTTPRDSAKVVAAWTPFLDRIGTEVGCQITPVPGTSTELVNAFKEERIDLVWVGNAPALEIIEQGNGEVFAQLVTPDGRFGYKSVLVVHKDSQVKTLEDVHRQASKLKFGDGELKSTSGHVVPLYYAFIKRGVNEPKKLFAQVVNNTHRENLALVERREVDVATANDVEMDFLKTERPQAAAALRVIWYSPEVPQSPLLWSLKLPVELRKKLRDAITSFPKKGSEQDLAIQKQAVDFSGFRKSRNQQLVGVADLEMFMAWQRINNNATLSADEKALQAKVVSARASTLEQRLRRAPSIPY